MLPSHHALLLGGPFAGVRPVEGPGPQRLTIALPEPASAGVRINGCIGVAPKRAPIVETYSRVDVAALPACALIYVRDGYEPTPDDEAVVREAFDCG